MMKSDTSPQLRNKMFLLLMFCFAAAILGDSTAEALLLARFGSSFIPRMFLVNAGVLFIFSAGMLSVVDRIDRRKFFFRALMVHGGVLLLLRVAVAAHWDFLFLPLFSYAYSSKILFFLLFWTVANDLIDSRSAGKQFPAIAAGGTIGAIGVSFSIPGLMRLFPVENLLIVWAVLIFITGLLLIPLRLQYRDTARRQRSRPEESPTVSGPSLLLLLRDEPLLRSMSILYFMVFFLLLNQHLIFYREVKETFSSAGSIAGFLGKFNGVSMLTTCILQVSLAGILLRKMGSTRSMLLLPSALLSVFIALAVVSTLPVNGAHRLMFWTVVGGMGIRMAFFDAFFSPNFQLFFSSLPKHLRGRGKLLIEGVVKPVAMVIAGSWLLWGVGRCSLHIQLVILIAISAAALLQTLLLKKAYTRTLSRYLTGCTYGKASALLERLEFSGNEDILSFLARQLDHEDFEVQKFLVEIIVSVGTEEAASILLEYMQSAEPRLRATIVISLGSFPGALVAGRLREYLADSDCRIVANAVSALSQCHATGYDEDIVPLVGHADRRVRINAILALWRCSSSEEQDRFFKLVEEMLHRGTPEDCASAIYALGELDDDRALDELERFCRKDLAERLADTSVKRQMVAALGKIKSPRTLELLLQIARFCPGQERKKIVAALVAVLPSIDEKIWRYGIEKGNAVYRNCLVQALLTAKIELSSAATGLLSCVALRELEALEWEKKSLLILGESGSGRMALLACTIKEELIAIRIDTLVHLVVLLDRTNVIEPVISRIYHSDPHVRARALEILENNGEVKINRAVIAAIEWLAMLAPLSGKTGAPALKREVMVAGSYCASHNDWVATCAEYACADTVA